VIASLRVRELRLSRSRRNAPGQTQTVPKPNSGQITRQRQNLRANGIVLPFGRAVALSCRRVAIMKTTVQGGYAVITVGQFANVCEARKSGRISFLALRVWLAAHEQRAKRCMAKGRVLYTQKELSGLIGRGLSELSVSGAMRELHRHQLIEWSPTGIRFPTEVSPEAQETLNSLQTNSRRPVPVPRFVLRGLFRHKRPSEVMAAIGHLIRCLFKRGPEISNHGLVKASWIASVFGVAERSVHSARKWMIGMKFLTQEVVHQLVMNRWGGKFLVTLTQDKPQGFRETTPTAKAKSAPPSETKNSFKSTCTYQINNKPAFAAPGVQANTPREPTLRNILPEDLQRMPRLENLYRQAIGAGWIPDCEASLRNFVCAALRATRAGGRVGAVFVGIVRKGLWHHVTQEQETRALQVLKRYRETNPWAFSAAPEHPRGEGIDGTRVAELVKSVLNYSIIRRVEPKEATQTVP
jgi:hypothetical protein